MATAVQVESIWNGLTDNSGQPLAAGKVYTYSAGTTTPVSLYTSSDKTSSATNPLILDGNGKAQVWADGRYKFVVKTAADVTLYTLDNLLYGFDDTTVLLGGISTGSANAQVVSVPATVESYANGQRITFIAGYTNSGATTLQFNSLSAISIVKGPTPSSLQAGDLIAGQLYSCTYYGGSFRLENVPTPADVQRSRAQVIASVAGINTITGTLTPALTGYETGEVFRFKAANSSTSAVTINIDGLGAKAIQYNNAALVAGEIAANVWHEIVYDGTQFQLLNPAMSAASQSLPASVGQVQGESFIWCGTSGGSANAQTLSPSPAITAYAAGQRFSFIAGYTSSSAATLNVSGLGAKNIYYAPTKSALKGNEIIAGAIYSVIYDGTQFLLMNTLATGTFTNDQNANNKINLYKSRGTTAGTNTIVQSGDQLGGVWFWGANGSGYDPAAAVIGSSDGTPGASADMPGRLQFYTTPDGSDVMVERMRINSLGQVLIGRTSASNNNESVAAGSGSGAQVISIDGGASGTGAGGAIAARNGGTTICAMGGYSAAYSGGAYDATPTLYFNNTPKVMGIGTGAGTWPMKYNTSTNAWTYDTSRRSAKDNIRDSQYGLASVLQLKPRQFNYLETEQFREDVGFIADEVFAVIPELAPVDENGDPAGVSYDRLTSVLCKAIQELNAQVESLKARVAALEA